MRCFGAGSVEYIPKQNEVIILTFFINLEFPYDRFSLGTNLAGFGLRNCHFFL